MVCVCVDSGVLIKSTWQAGRKQGDTNQTENPPTSNQPTPRKVEKKLFLVQTHRVASYIVTQRTFFLHLLSKNSTHVRKGSSLLRGNRAFGKIEEGKVQSHLLRCLSVSPIQHLRQISRRSEKKVLGFALFSTKIPH